jgi:GxxExxY protein
MYMLEANDINIITGKIIGGAIKVHSELGPGLLESAYKECLCYVLLKEGMFVEKEKPMPLIYENITLDVGYRIDLLVNHKVVVEIKAVESLALVHISQVLTYLRLSNNKVGLLLNFNEVRLQKGIKRIIL